MKTDYANVNGLVVGVRALLKKNGIKVGKWVQHGRFKGQQTFTGGAEVKTSWDEVTISVWDAKITHVDIDMIANVLVDNGVEIEYFRNGHQTIINIAAAKYCLQVRP